MTAAPPALKVVLLLPVFGAVALFALHILGKYKSALSK